MSVSSSNTANKAVSKTTSKWGSSCPNPKFYSFLCKLWSVWCVCSGKEWSIAISAAVTYCSVRVKSS